MPRKVGSRSAPIVTPLELKFLRLARVLAHHVEGGNGSKPVHKPRCRDFKPQIGGCARGPAARGIEHTRTEAERLHSVFEETGASGARAHERRTRAPFFAPGRGGARHREARTAQGPNGPDIPDAEEFRMCSPEGGFGRSSVLGSRAGSGPEHGSLMPMRSSEGSSAAAAKASCAIRPC